MNIIKELDTIVLLVSTAQGRALLGDYEAVTAILQGQVTPLVQQVAAESWRKYHVSGRVA